MPHQAVLFTLTMLCASFQISRSRVFASIFVFLHPPPWLHTATEGSWATEGEDTYAHPFVCSVTR
ncbi:unspecified product [Leishmania tarentolae]|uniref:Unspecified product n=1 Tax=Leishmania tarentolae TaxID=5689 RepID=A0A640KBN3_LEITA|nr:unspecified product [Leishmania tarentolae]GET86598.1 unspecified product [Leishmania tarentolae]